VRLSRPQVRRVDQDGLRELCRSLALQMGDFAPDVVVGIATGGADVAEHVVSALGGSPRLVITRSQRPGTRLKQKPLFAWALKAMPEALANAARWFEVEYREARYHLEASADRLRAGGGLARRLLGARRPHPSSQIVRPDLLAAAVAGAARIAVVDDTVDSGQTLVGVTEAVAAANPAAQIRTAAIATTWRRPPVQPDYVIQGRLLLRLPSSFDA